MKPLSKIEMAELKEVVKELNGLDEVEEKLRAVGVKKQAIVDSVTKTIEGLDDDVAEGLSDKTTEFYNDLFDKKWDDSKEEDEPKKEKKEKPPIEKSCFGHRVGTQAAQLDDMLVEGATIEEMAKAVKSTNTRVKTHISHLRYSKDIKISFDKETKKYMAEK